MYVDGRAESGRRVRVWVGRRAAFIIRRAGRSLVVLRPRLARVMGLRVGGVVALTAAPEGNELSIAKVSKKGSRFVARRAAAVARKAGRAKRA
jgi:hypothetical protein